MAKRLFGIMSPVLGLKKDFPTILLQNAFTPDNENVLLKYGEIHRAKMRLKELTDTNLAKVQTPDGFPILHYHWFVKHATGTGYLLAFTKAHIYHWNNATKVFDLKHTCASDCDEWSTVTFNDQVIATNDVDKVLTWNTTGDFTVLDTASGIEYATAKYLTKAKFVTAYENYLHLGYTTEDGTVHPQRDRWCKLGDETVWDSGDAGSAEIGKGDFLTGYGHYQGLLIIFKEESYYKMWLVPSTDIFNVVPLSTRIGCKTNHSIVNDKDGRLYFFASDYTFREIGAGEISTSIDPIVKVIKPSLASLIKSIFIDEYGEVWWAIPYGNDTTANNKVLTLKDGRWGQEDLAISAFGKYERQAGYTWDTLPFATWDTWGWDRWDTKEADTGFKIDLGADFSGYSYALHGDEKDNGEDYSGYFVLSTDLAEKQALPIYKRLLDMQLYFRKESTGTIDVYVKRDEEGEWQSAGSVSLTGSNDILVKEIHPDLRAKTFLIKCSGANKFQFLGAIFRYIPIGER